MDGEHIMGDLHRRYHHVPEHAPSNLREGAGEWGCLCALQCSEQRHTTVQSLIPRGVLRGEMKFRQVIPVEPLTKWYPSCHLRVNV